MTPDVPAPPPDTVAAAVSVQSDRFSDPLPLADLLASRLDGLQARHAYSLVYLRDEARVTAQLPAWADTRVSLSVLARQSATLVANRGAVALTQDIAANGPPPGDYRAQVSLRLRAFAGYGLAGAVQGQANVPTPWGDSTVHWEVGGQALQLVRILTRDITGDVAFDAASASYRTALQSDQFNDRHHYPYQGQANAQGWGWLTHWRLQWQATPTWRVHLGVDDVGRLHWQRLAHEQRTLNTDVARTDAQGNVVYSPLLQGLDSQDRLTLLTQATWRTGLAWQAHEHLSLEAEARKITGVQPWLPYSGLRLHGASGQFSAGWRWYEKALQLGWQQGPWLLTAAADRLDAQARTRQLGLRWQQAW